MKKTFAIFLLILLGFNSFGLFFFFWGEIQLCKIKAEDYSGDNFTIPPSSCTIFKSGEKGFKKINKNEILADGKRYDIIQTTINNGQIVYITLHDADEDAFTQDLANWGENNSQENSLPGKTINLQIAKFYTSQKKIAFKHILLAKHFNRMFAKNDSFLYTPPFIVIFTPPPDNGLS